MPLYPRNALFGRLHKLVQKERLLYVFRRSIIVSVVSRKKSRAHCGGFRSLCNHISKTR
jgi:hypothetical protein